MGLANAYEKVALVIGNKNYTNQTGLNNPIRDAKLIKQSLEAIDFKVYEIYDAKLGNLGSEIDAFMLKAKKARVALVYYAGHGVGVNGKNYLIPLNSYGLSVDNLGRKLISVEELKGAVAEAQHFGVVFFDACRSSFFRGNIAGLQNSRASRALVPPKATKKNILVSFSTQAGAIAKDDVDGSRYGPYALALSRNLNQKKDIRRLMGSVQTEVAQMTGDEQFPVEVSQLGGEKYCLANCNATPPPPPPAFKTPQMVHIRAGSFTMGSNNGDNDEKPPHKVSINYDFELSKYEVSVGEFRAFVNDTGYQTEAQKGDGCYVDKTGKGDWGYKSDANWKNPYFKQSDSHPVVCVSWNDAKAYAKWLSQKSGKNYRLPTEAEWEYAARAGSNTKWSFGENESSLCSYANIADQTAKKKYQSWTIAECNDGYVYTAPKGSFRANAFGLHDMHGNVWEWCEDWYADSYNTTPKDGRANTTKDKNKKVLRGGSWVNNPFYTRSAVRFWNFPSNRYYNLGFRLQRTLP